MDLALLSRPDRGGGDRATRSEMKINDLLRRCRKAVPLIAVLALGLALSACDKCGDFFWEKPGNCKGGPAPN